MDSWSKVKSLFMDRSKGLKLLLDAPNPPQNHNPPQNQSVVAFPVRPSAQVMVLNTYPILEAMGIHHWNVQHPAAVAQPIDIPGSSGSRVNDGGEFVVGSYRPPCPLHTYSFPRAITVIPDDHLRRTKSALF